MDIQDLMNSVQQGSVSLAKDGVSGDIPYFVDTGSYTLNAVLSGSIYSGLPAGKVTAFAGEESTGKTFFALSLVRHFLDNNPDGYVVYWDSESAITKEMLEERGIDTNRFLTSPVVTVEEFRHQASRMVNKYLERDEDDRPPMLWVMDSLGNLSTNKEIEDIDEGKDTRDMTRTQLIKGTFRALSVKLGQAKIPMVVTNHVYEAIGQNTYDKIMSGGSGLKYAASTVIHLRKRKEVEGQGSEKEVVGNHITCKVMKGRLTKENSEAVTFINYQTGLHRYAGMIELAVKHGILKSVSKRIELPNGTKKFAKQIYNEPESYFDENLLDEIDKAAIREYTYSGKQEDDETEDEEVGEETEPDS